MVFPAVSSVHFPGSGKPKTFFRTAVGFLFRHMCLSSEYFFCLYLHVVPEGAKGYIFLRFGGRKNHDDVSALGSGRLIDHRLAAEHAEKAVHDFDPHGRVRHLPAAHPDGDLHFVSVLEKFERLFLP